MAKQTFIVESVINGREIGERFSSKLQARKSFGDMMARHGRDADKIISLLKIVEESATRRSSLVLARKDRGQVSAAVFPEFFA